MNDTGYLAVIILAFIGISITVASLGMLLVYMVMVIGVMPPGILFAIELGATFVLIAVGLQLYILIKTRLGGENNRQIYIPL